MDKKEKKVEKSKGRARTVQERSKGWDDLNKKMLAKMAEEEAERLEKEGWEDEDEDMENDVENDVENGAAEKEMTDAAPESVPLPDEDEVL
jgi:hypothetical protein